MRQLIRAAGRLLLAAALVWTQTLALLPPRKVRAAGDIPPEQIRLFRAFELMRQRLDRRDFDPAAQAQELGDWRAAYAFVRDEIALLPYRGILRFADGTLASRAGNACDRALLLAELLRALGREVRFARARLDAAAVARLRGLIDRPPTAQTRPLAVDLPDPALEAAVVEAGLPVEAWRRALRETRDETAALLAAMARDLAATDAALVRLLPPPDAATSGEDQERAVRAALAEHCWVQLRTPEGWLDLDPTPGLEPGQTLAPAAQVSDEPDPALKPEMELRLLVHRRRGDARESEAVLAARMRPNAGLWTAQLAVIPEVQGPFLLQQLAGGGLRKGYEVHVPVLRAEGAELVGEPFDLTGRILDTDFQVRQARGVGEATGGLFGGALGALQEALGEGNAPPRKLPAVFDGLELRLTLRLPDGRVREARRLLVGPAPAAVLRRSLMLNAEIAVSAARMPRVRLQAATLETIRAIRPLWIAAMRGVEPLRAEMLARRLDAISSELYTFLQLRSAVSEYVMAELFPELVAVPLEPLVVMRLVRLRPDGEGVRLLRGFDLVFNRVRVIPREPAQAAGSSAAAVRLLSLVDNVLEHGLAGPASRSGVALLQAAAREGVGLRVVARPDELAGLDHIPPYARGLILEALAAGQRVVVPAGPLEDGRFGFWTFDPTTGAVHGFGADGTGQAMAEYGQQIAVLVAGSLAGCAVSALYPGSQMDFKDYVLCVAIGVVVGGLVNAAIARMAAYFGWGPLTTAATAGAADTAASTAAGRALSSRPPPPEPPFPSLAAEAGATGGARASAMRPAAMSRALAGAEPTPRVAATTGGGAAGARAGPARGGTIVFNPIQQPSPRGGRPLAVPSAGAGGTPPGGALGGLGALGRSLRTGAPTGGASARAKTGALARAASGAAATATGAPKPATAAVKSAGASGGQVAGPSGTAAAGRAPTTATPTPAGARPRPPAPRGRATAAAAGGDANPGATGRSIAPKAKGPGAPAEATASTGPKPSPTRPPTVRPRAPTPSPAPAAMPRAPRRVAALPRPRGALAEGAPPSGPRRAGPSVEPSKAGGGTPPPRRTTPAGAEPPPPEGSRPSAPKDLSKLFPEGPELASKTPEPVEVRHAEISPSMRRIRPQPGDTPEQAAAKARFQQAVEAAEAMNLSWTDIGQLRSMAKAYNSVIVTRGINRHAYRWYRRGAVGKNIFMKGKSADRGVIAGLIPENQAYSKLYGDVAKARARLRQARTEAERNQALKDLSKAWQKIKDFNVKVQEGAKKAGYEFVQFEVDGNPVSVYRKGDKIYQAYEKDGKLFDAATGEALPGKASDYALVEPLRVAAVKEYDPKTKTTRTRYVTADVDLDAVITGPNAPKEGVVGWKPATGELYGNRTPRMEAMLRGMRNVAEASGDQPKVSHGPEVFNPDPAGIPLKDFPRLAVFPDGSARVLRNPYDVWKLYSDLKKAGWNIGFDSPNFVRYLKKAGWIPEDIPEDNPAAVPPWWQEPPEAVRAWMPKASGRSQPRRQAPGASPASRPGCRRRRRSPCSALPHAA